MINTGVKSDQHSHNKVINTAKNPDQPSQKKEAEQRNWTGKRWPRAGNIFISLYSIYFSIITYMSTTRRQHC